MPPSKRSPQPLTLSAYAAHRKAAGLPGGTVASVAAARDAGRLSLSLTRDGRISSAAAADAEWEATTKAKMRPRTGLSSTPSPQGVGGDRLPGRPRKSRENASGLAESTARKAAADAGIAEIKLALAKGEVVLAQGVEERMVSVFSSCRTKLLAAHSRARQQDPGLTVEQLAMFEALVREALEELSAGAVEVAP